jgi:acyl-CoA thioester hydrolase
VRFDPLLLDRDSYPCVRVLETMFSDMDIQRHVNNVAIARFFEEARSALHYAIAEKYPDEFDSIVLAQLEVHYLREVSYPEPVLLAVGAGRIGMSSFQNVAALFQHGECAAVSWATQVRRTSDRRANQPLSETERQALTHFAVRGMGDAG